MGPAIEVHQLSKTYPGGIQAVKGIDFEVASGEVFGLLGPDGAGLHTENHVPCGAGPCAGSLGPPGKRAPDRRGTSRVPTAETQRELPACTQEIPRFDTHTAPIDHRPRRLGRMRVARTARTRNWRHWVVATAVLAVALVVGGPYAYIHLIEGKAPARLDVATQPTAGSAASDSASGSLDGTWTAGSGSQAGYRVNEILFGQTSQAVGRTSAVTGQLVLTGTQVRSGSFSVDLTKVTSDKQQRDAQFQSRIMDTASYPTATFKLVQPITLGSIPANGATVKATANGQLTLRGTTRPVAFDVTARRNGAGFQVSGSILVTFSDWSIPNPSFGPVTTDNHGRIEFLLTFVRT
jgi:polyisoprenoid-binding protein YceI